MVLEKDVISKLPTLSQAQLKEVRDRAALLLSNADASSNAHESLVHESIARVLRMSGVHACPPLRVALASQHAKQFKEGASVVIDFIDEYLTPASRTERARALDILIIMIARRIRSSKKGIPLTHKTISHRLSRVADYVDDAFPNYRESGLLHVLVKRKIAS